MRYFLKLSYDGTPFHGWQRQPNADSVQQTIEEALSKMLRRETTITGAGRTDTGVHARMMYAHFDCEDFINPMQFLSSINKMVGNKIAIDNILRVRDDAHARFDALSRTYKYYISLRKNPFSFPFTHYMHHLPDIEQMNCAARCLLETDDFTSFAKLHTDTKTNICKVTEAFWHYDKHSDIIMFKISADRFLRNMVRSVVGTLLEVGTGKIDQAEFLNIILKKNRCAAGMSMPAKGLFLTDIQYPSEIFI